MQPITVLLGIVLGTVFSIFCGLMVVSFVFWLLEADYPRLRSEIPELIRATGIFFVLSSVAGASFYGSLKLQKWRYIAIPLLWLVLFLAGYYYWPE